MKVINILDTGVFRGIGKPPNTDYDELQTILTRFETEIQLPRPIYAELGGDPDADSQPSGSDYVDEGIREGWIKIADPVVDSSLAADAVRDARYVMESEIAHPKTAVFEEDLSLIGVTMQLFEDAESIHVNLFTTDLPLHKAATAVIPYYGYYDFDAYFAAPQNVTSDLLHESHFTAGYRDKEFETERE